MWSALLCCHHPLPAQQDRKEPPWASLAVGTSQGGQALLCPDMPTAKSTARNEQLLCSSPRFLLLSLLAECALPAKRAPALAEPPTSCSLQSAALTQHLRPVVDQLAAGDVLQRLQDEHDFADKPRQGPAGGRAGGRAGGDWVSCSGRAVKCGGLGAVPTGGSPHGTVPGSMASTWRSVAEERSGFQASPAVGTVCGCLTGRGPDGGAQLNRIFG